MPTDPHEPYGPALNEPEGPTNRETGQVMTDPHELTPETLIKLKRIAADLTLSTRHTFDCAATGPAARACPCDCELGDVIDALPALIKAAEERDRLQEKLDRIRARWTNCYEADPKEPEAGLVYGSAQAISALMDLQQRAEKAEQELEQTRERWIYELERCEAAERKAEHLKLQAQIQAQEMRTQRSIVREIGHLFGLHDYEGIPAAVREAERDSRVLRRLDSYVATGGGLDREVVRRWIAEARTAEEKQ